MNGIKPSSAHRQGNHTVQSASGSGSNPGKLNHDQWVLAFESEFTDAFLPQAKEFITHLSSSDDMEWVICTQYGEYIGAATMPTPTPIPGPHIGPNRPIVMVPRHQPGRHIMYKLVLASELSFKLVVDGAVEENNPTRSTIKGETLQLSAVGRLGSFLYKKNVGRIPKSAALLIAKQCTQSLTEIKLDYEKQAAKRKADDEQARLREVWSIKEINRLNQEALPHNSASSLRYTQHTLEETLADGVNDICEQFLGWARANGIKTNAICYFSPAGMSYFGPCIKGWRIGGTGWAPDGDVCGGGWSARLVITKQGKLALFEGDVSLPTEYGKPEIRQNYKASYFNPHTKLRLTHTEAQDLFVVSAFKYYLKQYVAEYGTPFSV